MYSAEMSERLTKNLSIVLHFASFRGFAEEGFHGF